MPLPCPQPMDSTTVTPTIPDRPLRQRLTTLVFLAVFPVMLTWVVFRIVAVAWPLRSGWLLGIQIPALVIALLIEALALWLLFVPIRCKIQTGRFFRTRAETLQRVGEAQNRPPSPRLLIAPTLLTFFFLCFSVMGFSMAWHLRNAPHAIGLALLVVALLPTWIAFVPWFQFVRRKLRTGRFLPSQEELAQRRAKCAKPTSRPARAVAAIAWCFSASMWTFVAIARYHHHPHGSTFSPWITASITWVTAGIYVWQFFRPRTPPCAAPHSAS